MYNTHEKNPENFNKNNKIKVSAPEWNDKLESTDALCPI